MQPRSSMAASTTPGRCPPLLGGHARWPASAAGRSASRERAPVADRRPLGRPSACRNAWLDGRPLPGRHPRRVPRRATRPGAGAGERLAGCRGVLPGPAHLRWSAGRAFATCGRRSGEHRVVCGRGRNPTFSPPRVTVLRFQDAIWPCSRELALWPDVPVEVTGPDAIAGGRRCRAPLESGRRTRLHGRRAPATGEARWGRVAHGAHALSSFAGAVRSRVELRSCACGCQPSPLHSWHTHVIDETRSKGRIRWSLCGVLLYDEGQRSRRAASRLPAGSASGSGRRPATVVCLAFPRYG